MDPRYLSKKRNSAGKMHSWHSWALLLGSKTWTLSVLEQPENDQLTYTALATSIQLPYPKTSQSKM